MLAKSKKELHKRNKKNKNKKKNNMKNPNNIAPSSSTVRIQTRKIPRISIVKAPSVLSLVNNPLETLIFFRKVKKATKSLVPNGNLFFDLSAIAEVTVDAIMYFIATLKNTKRIKSLRIHCQGNFPSNSQSRVIFETCGFYEYVSVQSQYSYPKQNDKIKITRGKEANPILAGEICSFVHSHSTLNRIDTKFLYSMILELMTNTKQHAYNGNVSMDCNWYIFVEDLEDSLSFVFLDTGAGIPNTIRTKSFSEKIKNYFNFSDASFIASAFRGDVLRSETKLSYRGRGLPEIYKRTANQYINSFLVISGFGKCVIMPNGEIKETNFANDLLGTLFCWKIKKEANNEFNY